MMERRGLLDIIGESVLPGLYGKETVGDRVAAAQQGLLDAYATGGNKGLFDYMKTPAYTGPMNDLGGAFAGSVTGKAAKALPMDDASRMARARELGYTVDAYHGSPQDIQQFAPSRTGAQGAGSYFTDMPFEAGTYAGEAGSIYPVKLRMKNPYHVSPNENVYEKIGAASDEELISKLRALGHDGIAARMPATEEWLVKAGAPYMPERTHYVVLPGDESAIRSRFAAFDPAKADSADLLAARGPMTGPREDERKRKK